MHASGGLPAHALPSRRSFLAARVAGRYIEDLRKHTKAIQDGRLAHDNEGIKASLKLYGAVAVVPRARVVSRAHGLRALASIHALQLSLRVALQTIRLRSIFPR